MVKITGFLYFNCQTQVFMIKFVILIFVIIDFTILMLSLDVLCAANTMPTL